MLTSALIPGRSGTFGLPLGLRRTRTGTRCTTLVKLPVAFSGGRSENWAPVAGLVLSTLPWS